MKKTGYKKLFNLVAALTIAVPLTFSSAAQAVENNSENILPAQTSHITSDKKIYQSRHESQNKEAADIDMGSLEFISPWVLLGLGSLPLLLFLMRLKPPIARELPFPAIRHILALKSKEDQPATIPPWLRNLRLAVAAMTIVGLAHPLFNTDEPLKGTGSFVLVVDNGWVSANNWAARSAATRLIERAERDGRTVFMLATAPSEKGGEMHLIEGAEKSKRFMRALKAKPWPVDRQAALKALKDLDAKEKASIIWFSNGLADKGSRALTQRLRELGALTVFEDPANKEPLLLVPSSRKEGNTLGVTVKRPQGEQEELLIVTAKAEDGRIIEQIEVIMKEGQTESKASFNLPPEKRNEVTQISIDGEQSAGAVLLLDERYRRRPVGLLDSGGLKVAQPLLNGFNYLEKALDPYVDLRRGNLEKILQRELAVMILTDSSDFDKTDYKRIDHWIKNGGTVLRFAGPDMAENSDDDDLLPVELRQGSRTIGGAMSWSKPENLAPFDPKSPFYGIKLPDDVVIEKQVMAEPSLTLREKTWARLKDGTPLVTAEKRGEGWLILVHTTANASWSNLALSGVFIDMLRAVVAQSQGVAGHPEKSGKLQPFMTLNEKGQITKPPASVQNLHAESIKDGLITPQNPPGFYGDDSVRRAHNLASAVPTLTPFPTMPDDVTRKEYIASEDNDIAGPLLAGALLLVLLDQLAVMGIKRGQKRGAEDRKLN